MPPRAGWDQGRPSLAHNRLVPQQVLAGTLQDPSLSAQGAAITCQLCARRCVRVNGCKRPFLSQHPPPQLLTRRREIPIRTQLRCGPFAAPNSATNPTSEKPHPAPAKFPWDPHQPAPHAPSIPAATPPSSHSRAQAATGPLHCSPLLSRPHLL